MTVLQFADSLGLQVGLLLERLQAAGVDKQRAIDSISENDKTKLLAYLRHSRQKLEEDHDQLKTGKLSSAPALVFPKGDNRRRVSQSVKLWVVKRSFSKDKSHVEICGVIESIERCVYRVEGKSGQWVIYSSRYHSLYSAEEFFNLLANARKCKYDFFNNELGGSGRAATNTSCAPFIFCDEYGLV